jgi:glutamine cyclotransferase
MKKQHLTIIFIVTVALVLGSAVLVLLNARPADTTPVSYTYTVVNVYLHDPNAFTQGLVIENGVLYEGTGLYGKSSLRCVELETGEVKLLHSLPGDLFGEGITVLGNRIFQLTWRSQKGFVYNKHSFDLLQEFSYTTEGWGITNDGNQLIMSDGTANLYFLDPETFETVGQVEVHDNGPVTNLNELEYINGEVYANVWQTDKIAIIDPHTGQVTGWIDLTGIYTPETSNDADNVLNGIAYDTEGDRLFVTGKRWSQLFQIELNAIE